MKKLFLVTLVSFAAYTASLAAPVAHTNTAKGVYQTKHGKKHHKHHHHKTHAAMNTPAK